MLCHVQQSLFDGYIAVVVKDAASLQSRGQVKKYVQDGGEDGVLSIRGIFAAKNQLLQPVCHKTVLGLARFEYGR